MASLRLAYQDLELQRKKDEEKMRGLEGKKKEQAERLGMGFSNRRSGILIQAVILKFGVNFHAKEVCFFFFVSMFCINFFIADYNHQTIEISHPLACALFLHNTVNSR